MVSLFDIAARYVPVEMKMVVRNWFGCRNDPYDIETEMCRFHGQLAVDVGANDGHTTKLLSLNFPQVIAFEPHPRSFWKLHKMAWQYDGRITVNGVAVGSHSGIFELSETSLSKKSGMFIDPSIRHHWGTITRRKKVKFVSLDDYFEGKPKPDFVKIDVEGGEIQVLTGMKDLIRDKRPRLFVEVHSRNNVSLIKKAYDATYLIRELKHPSLKPESDDWKDHSWLICTPY